MSLDAEANTVSNEDCFITFYRLARNGLAVRLAALHTDIMAERTFFFRFGHMLCR